jgi:hypothetical protein
MLSVGGIFVCCSRGDKGVVVTTLSTVGSIGKFKIVGKLLIRDSSAWEEGDKMA